MLSTSRIFGVISCGFVLCIDLSDAEAGPIAMQEDQASRSQSGQIITGEVLRVEGDHLFVKEETGKEVGMHIDQTTRMSHKKLVQGDLIEATVNDESHALSIYSYSADRRSDHTLEPTHVPELP